MPVECNVNGVGALLLAVAMMYPVALPLESGMLMLEITT